MTAPDPKILAEATDPSRSKEHEMAWNYRVFRCADPDGSPVYEMREVHYTEASEVNGWTESACWPMGETLDDLVSDLAWFITALSKPVLDGETGLECEPAKMLKDDLEKWFAEQTKRPAHANDKGLKHD